MSRREYTTTLRCAKKDCRETTFFVSTTQRDRAEALSRYQKNPWHCSRHDQPDQVLRPDNTARHHVMVATRLRASTRAFLRSGEDPGFLPGLFWIPEGGTTGSGFTRGPGFKAHADDFPEGTRLVVTAYVETPGQRAIAADVDGAAS